MVDREALEPWGMDRVLVAVADKVEQPGLWGAEEALSQNGHLLSIVGGDRCITQACRGTRICAEVAIADDIYAEHASILCEIPSMTVTLECIRAPDREAPQHANIDSGESSSQ